MQKTRSWWQYPHVWLVVAGPLVVVIASFVTFYLAARSADPVLPTTPQAQSADDAGTPQGISLAPALQARNHAATGVLPANNPHKKP